MYNVFVGIKGVVDFDLTKVEMSCGKYIDDLFFITDYNKYNLELDKVYRKQVSKALWKYRKKLIRERKIKHNHYVGKVI